MKHARAIGLTLMICGCESAPQPAPLANAGPSASPARVARTQPHFAAASDLQLAVVQGRLTDARDAARSLTTEPVSDPRWQSQVLELRAASATIAEAADLDAAARQLGRLGAACGGCHEALGARVTFALEPPPGDELTVADQMRHHGWAAARLWEGLAGPADASWQAGARELATTRFDLAATVHEKPNVEVFELAEQLRAHAGRAGQAGGREARAGIYGDVMGACVGCHDITRPHPVARR